MNKSFRKLLRGALLFSCVINLLWLAPAMFSLQVFDRVLTSQSRETLLVLLLGVVVAVGLISLLDYVRGRLQGVMGNIVNDGLSPMMARLTLAKAARRQGPLSTEELRDVGRLRALFSAQGLMALFDLPWAVVFIAVIWLAHPWLGGLALASAVLMVGLAVLNDRVTRESIRQLQGESGRAQRYLEQAMGNAEVAQALGMGEALVSRWVQLSAAVSDLQRPTAARTVTLATLTKVLRQMVQILMTALGAYLVISGESTSGVLIAASMLLGRALAPVEQIVGSWRVLAEGRMAWQRLDPLIREMSHQPERMTLPEPKGQLVAQGLVFRAPRSERVILGGVSLQLEPGESLAILGPSGAGKSTLIRLLIGLWKPSAGTVRLDGVDLPAWDREEVGPHIGYVPQDVELFAGSVADNIARMGVPDPLKVVEAARLARVHELILALPEGYDTQIDPHSALLSPGQRQRIALARALYGDPKLVLLDEPNSNLDGVGEMALAETLKDLRGRCTVVVVTHRTALTQFVDKMLVIESGRQTQYGTAAEVLQALQSARHGAQVVPIGRAPAAAEGPASVKVQMAPVQGG